MFFAWNVRGLNSETRHTSVKDWIRKYKPLFGAYLETKIQHNNASRISGALPVGWKHFANSDNQSPARIIVVWHPTVSVTIYQASPQVVTCGIFILADNLSLTVSFVYGFNQVEERQQLWDELAFINANTPASRYPWAVLGDFNQILRSDQHSQHLTSDVDTAGMEDFNLALQEAELFEAQANGLTYSWWNNQDANPVSKKIVHALFNQHWAQLFPDFDHPDYLDTVRSSWSFETTQGSQQFRLARSLKLLKPALRNLNARNYSGITLRVQEQVAQQQWMSCENS
ncbi:hypothetical protein IGI04_036517 [Brassica rapa subsp. trilocularis]|uniref:Endonuclease/exonuclease/phosphatase domain-containing protein n=1 Tax=Brassica rapa subsp. trilocularis TaxID=1813537 RepID=A0ABQ7LFN6_BRACM|nr:hypothetical protein IGI04_036517 [Brassica rapa subsp. trilocularis]